MKKLLPVIALLLNACVSHWPAGSYSDLANGTDDAAVTSALSECTANLVSNHTLINIDTTRNPALAEALSQMGLQISPAGSPVTYVVASAGAAESVFIRVSAPRGTCSQYFIRDGAGTLRNAGPLMLVLR